MIGRSVTRLPVALNTALAIAAGTHADDDELAEALHADGVGNLVLGRQKHRIKGRDVGVHGNQVIRHVRVDDSPVAVIKVGALQQCHSDTADHAADGLAVRKLGVDHPAGVVAGV